MQSAPNGTERLLGDAIADEEIPLPSVARLDAVDLDAEGLDLAALRDRLPVDRTDPTPNGTPDATQRADRQGAATDRAMTDGTASEWATTDGAPDIETTLTEIAARLGRIEAAVIERGVDARVVDVGDGTHTSRCRASGVTGVFELSLMTQLSPRGRSTVADSVS